MINRNNVLVVITKLGSITINEGDILGVRLNHQDRTSSGNTIIISLHVQKQSNDYDQIYYGVTPATGPGNTFCPEPNYHLQGRPYISVNVAAEPVAPPIQQCTSGFYDQQSLRNLLASRYLYFPGIPPVTMSMPFSQCGLLTRMIIVAKFNKSVPVGWPELQIIRASNGMYCVVFTTDAIKPELIATGNHNVYEYDSSTIRYNIQPGDMLNISWYGDALQQDQIRFSLAYYINGTPPGIPMVNLSLSSSCAESTQQTQNNLYCQEIDQPTTSSIPVSRPSTHFSATTQKANINITTSTGIAKSSSTKFNVTIVISGVVSCSILSCYFYF